MVASLEGESSPTPAENTVPHSNFKTRFRGENARPDLTYASNFPFSFGNDPKFEKNCKKKLNKFCPSLESFLTRSHLISHTLNSKRVYAATINDNSFFLLYVDTSSSPDGVHLSSMMDSTEF